VQAIITLTLNPALDLSTSTATILPSEKLRCAAPRHDPGGGGINVARAIHALGGQALAVFPAGGPTGALLETLLAAEGVSSKVIPIAGLTRENLAVDEVSTGRQFRFVMPGPCLSEAERVSCLDTLERMRPKPDYVVVSGSLPPDCPADFYGQIAQWATRHDLKLILDTSGPALNIVRQAGVFLLKPSWLELEQLVGRKLSDIAAIATAAAELVARRYAQIVVASVGPDGAVVASPAGTEHFAAPQIEVKSTVGAGDSMVAGIVFGLSQGRSLAQAARLGIAAGAAALMRPGTELCRREDVVRFLMPQGLTL